MERLLSKVMEDQFAFKLDGEGGIPVEEHLHDVEQTEEDTSNPGSEVPEPEPSPRSPDQPVASDRTVTRQLELAEAVARQREQLATLGDVARQGEEEVAAMSALLEQREEDVARLEQENAILREQVRISDTQERLATATLGQLREEHRNAKQSVELMETELEELRGACSKLRTDSQDELLALKEKVDAAQRAEVEERARRVIAEEDVRRTRRESSLALAAAQKASTAPAAPVAPPAASSSSPGRKGPKLSLSLASSRPAWMQFLSWRNAKVGVVVACVLCVLTFWHWWSWVDDAGATVTREELLRRVEELAGVVKGQKADLDGCRTALKVITQKMPA